MMKVIKESQFNNWEQMHTGDKGPSCHIYCSGS